MRLDGSLLRSSSKSLLTHEQENMASATPVSENSEASTIESIPDRGTASGVTYHHYFDRMAVEHDLRVHKGHIDNCQDISAFFIRSIDNNYFFHTYSLMSTAQVRLKDRTRQLRTAS